MKTAVILTARRERDSEIPYPLIPFDGEKCLIDRTLDIISHLCIVNIIMLTVFKSELLEFYNQASLAVAKDFIHEDFLLIEGDTFYESKVIECLVNTPHKTCLAITEESGNGDEAFVELNQGFVTKISKDKHQLANFEGELLGVCKISYEVYHGLYICS